MSRHQQKPKWPGITWTSSPEFPSYPSSGNERPRILGINPWIYDFAAYDFWSRPAGLLTCLRLMREAGAETALLDCLDPMWSDVQWPKRSPYGTGAYPKSRVDKPDCLLSVPRHYSRYGLSYELVAEALSFLKPRPDCIFITSIMTYWYPGVLAVIDLVRKTFPGTPVVLGGIYASLCREHAQIHADADLIISGPLEHHANWKRVWELLGRSAPVIPGPLPAGPALDCYPDPWFSIVLGSKGCPFHCAYCASDLLNPGFEQRSFEALWADLQAEIDRGVRDFAFYDDALLIRPQTWLLPLLRHLGTIPAIRLHTPNALHVRSLTPELCALLYRAGLTTVRLGLESADFSGRADAKLTRQDWEAGLGHLFAAGFQPEQIGAYILFGLPDQDDEEVIRAARFARQHGVRPHLAQYTPIPGSVLFAKAKEVSPHPIEREPLLQNNSLWPCKPGGFSWQEHTFWKKLTQGS